MWMHGVKSEESYLWPSCWTDAQLDFSNAFDIVPHGNLRTDQIWGPSRRPTHINQHQMKPLLDMRMRLLLKLIIVSMDYVHCVAKQRYTFETCHIHGKKQSCPSWLTIIIRFSLATALKINGLQCPTKDLSII